MEAILVNYNFDPQWLLEAPHLNPITIYDRSDDGIVRDLEKYGKVIKQENIGNVDFPKLSYLIENYDSLPDVFLWSKTNLFKYLEEEEFEKIKDFDGFLPLMSKNHRTYSDNFGVVNFYKNDWYWERNDDWYFGQFQRKYVNSFGEWTAMFDLPNTPYIPFCPGGNFLLTREKVHKYPVEFYKKMRDTLSYCQLPVEAFCAERSYGLMWG